MAVFGAVSGAFKGQFVGRINRTFLHAVENLA